MFQTKLRREDMSGKKRLFHRAQCRSFNRTRLGFNALPFANNPRERRGNNKLYEELSPSGLNDIKKCFNDHFFLPFFNPIHPQSFFHIFFETFISLLKRNHLTAMNTIKISLTLSFLSFFLFRLKQAM